MSEVAGSDDADAVAPNAIGEFSKIFQIRFGFVWSPNRNMDRTLCSFPGLQCISQLAQRPLYSRLKKFEKDKVHG